MFSFATEKLTVSLLGGDILKARRILLGATASILSFMLIAFILKLSQKPVELHAQKAKKTSINNSLSVQGTLEPIKQSSITSAHNVTVKESYVKAGDYVKKGEPLLQVEENTISQSDPLHILSVLVEQNFNFSNQFGAVLYADMDGIVTECAPVGEKLNPMQTAVKLADFSQAVITIEIPELYAPGISIGQPAKACLVSEQDKVFSGKITEIDSQVKQKLSILDQEPKRTVNCRVTLSETEETLRPGSSMDVSIITDSIQNAVTIPYAGVHQMDTQEYVYVVSANGIEKRFVETGYHLASEIQIEKGILDGEWVLIDENIPEDLTNGYTVVRT